MASHSVDVLIKARDQASRKFHIIGGAAAIMGKALKGAASITKTVFVEAFRAAKYAAIGLGAAFSYCTYAAIKQEAAEIELASALKMVGKYSEETMQKLKAQAAEIQRVTVYGDEYILTLMRMAMTLGATEDKAAEAAKAAIALYEGFGGGRGKPEIFLRYYMDALRGTGSSLASYVGELRKAKTQEEKMQILQDAMARGWDVAKSKAESAGGALKQMKNKLSDVAETIAKPFLPAIASSAKAIKNWAIENEDNIAYWAKKTHSYVTLIKDVFLDFVKFMREDWRSGLGFVFDSFLKLLKATFEAAVALAIAGGKGIWRGVKIGIFGSKGVEARAKELYWRHRGTKPMSAEEIALELGKPLKERALYKEYLKQAEAEFQKKGVKSILGGTISAVTDSFREAFTSILKDMPEDLRKKVDEAWAKHLERLKELGEAPGRRPLGAGAEAGAPSPFDLLGDVIRNTISRIKQGLRPLEARFLTFAPGARFNPTEKNTRDTARSARDLVKLGRITVQELKAIREKEGTAGIQLAISNFS